MNAGLQLELGPSRRARQVYLLSAMLTAATAAACVVAFVLSPSGSRAAVVLAALSAAAVIATRSAAAWTGKLTIDADGTVHVDSDRGNQSASVGYCGAQFICLRARRVSFGVWPDALGAIDWRRFLVACRWPRGQSDVADGRKRTK
jgi:hypothetical protein